ncbi:hypothetical protein BD809_106110 [Aquimarina intermedia]|uniref:PKD domain-containing protein n=2 Tax=Aquimarina intermedia TaxID=350814 RepID=A0A5S5C3F7_9FLAO|nr:hypothetical protein BD809_106110 [Aquimarina intermedia]
MLSLGVIVSCVNDDTTISTTNEPALYDQSIHLVSVLNDFSKNIAQQPETDQCFSFKYPIKLSYNTDATVELNSYAGLRTTITNQSDNFNIVGLVFPIEISFPENLATLKITSENEFLEVLNNCRIRSFRTEFNEFYNRCFDLDFPFSILQSNNQPTVINTSQEFNIFLQSQQTGFQPVFDFPITLIDKETQVKRTVATYYEIYQTINSCPDIFELCPAYDFSVESTSSLELTSTFVRSNPTSIEFSPYTWSVDGVAVKSDGGASGNNLLEYSFSQPGFYTVCIESQEACLDATQFCKEIVVPEYCAPLSFISSQVTNSLEFNFTADFADRDALQYSWFIDGVLIEANDGGLLGDNVFNFTFAPGSHTVCIEAVSASCPQGMEYCEEIIVPEYCSLLSFVASQVPNSLDYTFTADFKDRDVQKYNWLINGVLIEADDGGPTGDNLLNYTFAPGSYTVCIEAVSASCPQGMQYCMQIEVAPICPQLEFTYEKLLLLPLYSFTADFPEKNDVTYSWYIDNVFIEEDGGGVGGDNVMQYNLLVGVYEVCIRYQSPECPDGIEFCETVTVL